jgi:hypothetical protein
MNEVSESRCCVIPGTKERPGHIVRPSEAWMPMPSLQGRIYGVSHNVPRTLRSLRPKRLFTLSPLIPKLSR